MKIIICILITTLFLSCNSRNQNINDSGLMSPEWKDVDTKSLPVMFGDIIRFKINNTVVKAIILDFDKDEGGIWIGMCFIKGNKLFGRQIPSGYNGNCMDLLDCTYLNTTALKSFEKIKTEKIDIRKISIGSNSPATNLSDILRDYSEGLKLRTKKQTPCNKDIFDRNVVRECYFDLDKFY